MAYPHTLGNSLRMYDQAIYNWLDALKIDYGEIAGVPRRQFGILRVLATPKRAFSRMENILVRKGWLDPSDPGPGSGTLEETLKSYQRIPLPFVSVYVQPPAIDSLRNSVFSFRHSYASMSDLTSQKHPYPVPITLPVQLDFWMKKKFTDLYIKEWLISNVNVLGTYANEFMLQVTPLDNLGQQVWGNKLIPVTIESIDDASDLEPGEGDRLLRTTVMLTMSAWMFMPYTTLDLVKEFNFGIQRLHPLGDPDIEYGDFIYYKFSLISIDGWYVYESNNDETFETEEQIVLYIPGANPLEYLGSNQFPVEVSDYVLRGNFKGEGDLTIEIWDSVPSLLTSTVFPLGVKITEEEFEFSIAVPDVCMVRMNVTGRVVMGNVDLKRK